MPSLVASTMLPPFPVLYFPITEYKRESKRSVAKALCLHMPSLFGGGNFPKNFRHTSLHHVRTGSPVSHGQSGIDLSWWTSMKRQWLLSRPATQCLCQTVLSYFLLLPSSLPGQLRCSEETFGFGRGKSKEALRNRSISSTHTWPVTPLAPWDFLSLLFLNPGSQVLFPLHFTLP